MSIIGALSAHNHIPGILSLYCSIVLLKYFFLKMTYTYSSGNPLFKIAAYCVIPFRDNIQWYLVQTRAFRGGYRASAYVNENSTSPTPTDKYYFACDSCSLTKGEAYGPR